MKHLTKRKDGRYRTSLTIKGEIKYFYGSTEKEAKNKRKKYNPLSLLEEKSKKITAKSYLYAVADEWLLLHKSQIKQGTYDMYLRHIHCIKNNFSNMQIDKIDFAMLQEFLNKLAAKNMAKSTIGKTKTTLTQIFKHAIKCNMIKTNPCDSVEMPLTKLALTKKALSEDDIKKINENVDKPFGLFVFVSLWLGLRRSECVALKWSDFDFDKNTLRLCRVAIFDSNTAQIDNCLKNRDKERTIPLPGILKDILTKYRNNDEWVFNINGEVLKESQLESDFKKYKEATKLTFTLHSLRHTYATILYNAGVDVKTAQLFLGHHDANVTMNIYTHLDNCHIDSGSDKINDYFNKVK